jgi:hypothetical protein
MEKRLPENDMVSVRICTSVGNQARLHGVMSRFDSGERFCWYFCSYQQLLLLEDRMLHEAGIVVFCPHGGPRALSPADVREWTAPCGVRRTFLPCCLPEATLPSADTRGLIASVGFSPVPGQAWSGPLGQVCGKTGGSPAPCPAWQSRFRTRGMRAVFIGSSPTRAWPCSRWKTNQLSAGDVAQSLAVGQGCAGYHRACEEVKSSFPANAAARERRRSRGR